MNVRHDMVTVFVLRADTGGGHEMLQLRRAKHDYMGETWQTVRGVIEAGETAPKAALRELREETALVPRELYGLSAIDSFYTARYDTIWHCAVFAALVEGDAKVRLNEEHDAFRWLPLSDAPAAIMWQRERELLAEIQRDILQPSLARAHLRIRIDP